MPSAIDFAIYKGTRSDLLSISEIVELSSDHIPLTIHYRVSACKLSRKTCVLPQNANISQFQEAINGLVNLNMQLNTPDDIDDATEVFLRNIHIAAESSTCGQRPNSPSDPPHALLKPEVLDLVRLKRTSRRRFMRSRDPADKREYRRTEDDLKKLLLRTKSEYFADMLRNADPTKP